MPHQVSPLHVVLSHLYDGSCIQYTICKHLENKAFTGEEAVTLQYPLCTRKLLNFFCSLDLFTVFDHYVNVSASFHCPMSFTLDVREEIQSGTSVSSGMRLQFNWLIPHFSVIHIAK